MVESISNVNSTAWCQLIDASHAASLGVMTWFTAPR